MDIPLVSVLISSCNYRFVSLIEVVPSVLRSTYRNIEIIVVGDRALDIKTKTELDMITQKASCSITYYIHESNRLSQVMELGVNNSRGQYTLILDDGDLIEPTLIMKSVWHLERNSSIDFVYSNTFFMEPTNNNCKEIDLNLTSLEKVDTFPRTFIIRKEVLLNIDKYDESINYLFKSKNTRWKGLILQEKLVMSYKNNVEISRGLSNSGYEEIPKNKSLLNNKMHSMANIFIKFKDSVKLKGLSILKRLPKPLISQLFKLKESVYPEINKVDIKYKKCASILSRRDGDNRISIMIVLPWLRIGGVEQVFADILANLPNNRYNIFLSTTLKDEHVWNGKFKPLVKEILHLSDFCGDYKEQAEYFLQFMIDNCIDVIHISNSQFAYKMIPILKEYLPEIIVLDTLHMEEPEEPWDYFRFSCQYDKFIDSRVVITESLKKTLREKYGVEPAKINVIENGINTPMDIITKKKSSKLRLGFIGRFVQQKQPDIFVEVVRELVKENNQIEAFMIGDGPLWNKVVSLVNRYGLGSYITLLGARNNANEILRGEIDILIAPSLREGLPIVGLEAMASRVPIVCADVPGWNDLIENDITGYLVDFKDIKSYTEKTLCLLNDEQLRENISAQAFNVVKEKYSAEKMAQKYSDLYCMARL